MSFQQTVPSQRLAQQYVREVAAEYLMPLRIGGHSKGSCVVEITDGSKKYVVCGDECYSPLCLEKRIPTGSSVCPERSRQFIDKYGSGEYVALLCHQMPPLTR